MEDENIYNCCRCDNQYYSLEGNFYRRNSIDRGYTYACSDCLRESIKKHNRNSAKKKRNRNNSKVNYNNKVIQKKIYNMAKKYYWEEKRTVILLDIKQWEL